jgi:hypothetical protein
MFLARSESAVIYALHFLRAGSDPVDRGFIVLRGMKVFPQVVKRGFNSEASCLDNGTYSTVCLPGGCWANGYVDVAVQRAASGKTLGACPAFTNTCPRKRTWVISRFRNWVAKQASWCLSVCSEMRDGFSRSFVFVIFLLKCFDTFRL